MAQKLISQETLKTDLGINNRPISALEYNINLICNEFRFRVVLLRKQQKCKFQGDFKD